MGLKEDLLGLVESVMPESTDIKFQSTSDHDDTRITASWLLNADPARLHKRSKTIIIIFTYEMISDFRHLAKSKQEVGLSALRANLAERLKDFDPQHDNPAHEVPPTEDWLVGISVLKSGV